MTEELSTNRLVLVDDEFVYKLPVSDRGRRANIEEYQNFCKNPDIIAYSELNYWGLKQERLTNIIILPMDATLDDVPECCKHLWQFKLHNRFQVGRGKDGKWKFYDYEDTKFYERVD